jgi:DNA polymerase-3 subunit beta
MVLLLKRAKRARVSFEGEDITKPSSLIIDTELIRYKWVSNGGQYPDYEKLIPNEFNTYAHFDTIEAVKAISSLKALADSKSYPIDLTIGNGKIVLANPDDKGQTEISADTNGEGYARIDGSYLTQALKTCGDMVDFSLTNALSPILFSANGYKVVVMPIVTEKAQKEAKATEQATTEGKPEPVTEPEAVAKAEAKPKRSRKRERVAVA